MIARRWHGRVPGEKAAEYLRLMKDVGLADYRSTEGNRGAWCLFRRDNGIAHQEKDLSLTEIYRADEMFCTGTLGELAPVVKVDDRTIGAGARGPLTDRLMKLFRELTERAGTPVC